MSKLPLEGVSLAEFAAWVAGPTIGQQLGWLGATVIKIESEKYLDAYRLRHEGKSLDTNLNKLSVALDLTRPEAVEVVKRIVRTCDIAVESYVPGVMSKLGLDYESLKQVKPDLIMISVTGFGQTGPEAQYRSLAASFAAMGGLSYLTAYPGGVPSVLRLVMDTMTGQYAVSAVLAALLYRRRTGRGQHIDFSALEATVCSIGDQVLDYTMNGHVAEAKGNEHDSAAPHNCYRCKEPDSWISVAIFTDGEWQAFCQAMERVDLVDDPRFSDSLSRHKNRYELDTIISQWTAGYSDYELMHKLQSFGVAAMPSLNSAEAFTDPHLIERGFIQEIARDDLGTFRIYGSPWRLNNEPIRNRRAGPRLGQDSDYVLTELTGMSLEEVCKLREQRVIT